MSLKIITIFLTFACVYCVPLQYHEFQQQQHYQHPNLNAIIAAQLPSNHYQKEHEAEHTPAEYQFEYGVHDEHTGDIKNHQESRKGDHVEGKYELVEPDGHKRIVEYTADKHTGFNAVVHREPTDYKVPVPVQQVHQQPKNEISIGAVTKFELPLPVNKGEFDYSGYNAGHFAMIQNQHLVPTTIYNGGGGNNHNSESHVRFHDTYTQYQY